MLKRIIIIIFAYVGISTGAGLASGQELLQYFISFGKMVFVGISIVAVLHTLVGGMILNIGSHFRSKAHSEVIGEIVHPIAEKIFDIIIIASSFILGFVMLPGAGSNLHQQFGYPTWVGSLICGALVVIVSMLDLEIVSKIIGSFTPLIFIFIIIALIYTLINGNNDFEMIQEVSETIPTTLPNWWISFANYFGMCIMVGAAMYFVLGGDKLNPKAAKIGGFISGGIVGFLTFALGIILFLSIEFIKDADLPTQVILNNIHPTPGF